MFDFPTYEDYLSFFSDLFSPSWRRKTLADFWILSACQLEYASRLARLRFLRRRHAHVPTSNTASHNNHEKISILSFSFFLLEYWAQRWSSAKNRWKLFFQRIDSLSAFCTYVRDKTSKDSYNTLANLFFNFWVQRWKQTEQWHFIYALPVVIFVISI